MQVFDALVAEINEALTAVSKTLQRKVGVFWQQVGGALGVCLPLCPCGVREQELRDVQVCSQGFLAQGGLLPEGCVLGKTGQAQRTVFVLGIAFSGL